MEEAPWGVGRLIHQQVVGVDVSISGYRSRWSAIHLRRMEIEQSRQLGERAYGHSRDKRLHFHTN